MASLCQSLRCLISALTQAGRVASCSGSLVQFSPAAGRARRCRQTSLCVGRPHSVPATLGLPRSRVCTFPVYTAQAPGCSIWSGPCVACGSSFRVLHKSVESVGPAFYAFPARAAQAARGLGALSPVRCAFSPPRAQPQFPRARRCCAPYVCSGELSLAATLWANVSHPESQEVFG